MPTLVNLRASDRIPVSNRVNMAPKGRIAFVALAINLSLGGVLLRATPSLPVGSPCELTIHSMKGKDGQRVVREGTVIRNNATGTAIQFSKPLEEKTFNALTGSTDMVNADSIVNRFLIYFRIGNTKGYPDCEKLLGVTKKQYRTVFLSTFFLGIPLSVLPVWAFYDAIVLFPDSIKIGGSITYGFLLFGVVQPIVDLTIFKIIKHRSKQL